MAAEVRPAVAGDVEAIQEIGRKTWPDTYRFAGEGFIAHGLATWWSREALLRSLDETIVLVAVESGEVIGTATSIFAETCPSSGSFELGTPRA